MKDLLKAWGITACCGLLIWLALLVQSNVWLYMVLFVPSLIIGGFFLILGWCILGEKFDGPDNGD